LVLVVLVQLWLVKSVMMALRQYFLLSHQLVAVVVVVAQQQTQTGAQAVAVVVRETIYLLVGRALLIKVLQAVLTMGHKTVAAAAVQVQLAVIRQALLAALVVLV
jgi:hypothetical protein